MARASLLALGLLVFAAVASAQYTYSGKSMFDLYAQIKDADTGLDGIMVASLGAIQADNKTVAGTGYLSHPYSGVSSAWFSTASAPAVSAALGTVTATSAAAYTSFSFANATILSAALSQGGVPVPVEGLRFYITYTVSAKGNSTSTPKTFTAWGPVSAVSSFGYVAGLNGRTVQKCAPPLLAIAVYPTGVTAVPPTGNSSATILFTAGVVGSALKNFYVGSSVIATSGTSKAVVYTDNTAVGVSFETATQAAATGGTAATAREYAGEFPNLSALKGSTVPAFPNGADATGYSSACNSDEKKKPQNVKMTLAISQTACTAAAKPLETGFLQLLGNPDSVTAPVTCLARRSRKSRRLQADSSTANFAVTSTGTYNAFLGAQAVRALLGSTSGLNAFIAAVTAANGGTAVVSSVGSIVGADGVTTTGGGGVVTAPTPTAKPPVTGDAAPVAPALATLFAAIVAMLALLL